jgi:hypothetical protein
MKLTPQLRAALAECAAHNRRDNLYWWRRTSMAKLEAMGLVEVYTPPSVAERPKLKLRPYRITPAGRLALQEKNNG